MFYEDLSRAIPKSNPIQRQGFSEATVINAQNVFDYWRSEDRQWSWGDFPNIAPPFDSFFVEWKYNDGPQSKYSFGMWVQSFEVDNFSNLPGHFSEMDPINPKWLCLYFFFSRKNNDIAKIDGNKDTFHYASWAVAVDKDGRVCKQNGTNQECVSYQYDGFQSAEERGNMLYALGIPLLTISFLHCKNVELVERAPARFFGKRNRHGPRIRYHVLEIEPMKKILRYEGRSEETGLKLALHICRGHFKDFSKGKGLFGKYQGMYWWDSQVRGNISNGIVSKDYSVNPKEN